MASVSFTFRSVPPGIPDPRLNGTSPFFGFAPAPLFAPGGHLLPGFGYSSQICVAGPDGCPLGARVDIPVRLSGIHLPCMGDVASWGHKPFLKQALPLVSDT